MRRSILAIVAGWFFTVGFAGTGLALPASLPDSLHKLMDTHVLQVKKKKKNCFKVFECDYYAPATSCSQPPCCKKGRWEKVCDTQP